MDSVKKKPTMKRTAFFISDGTGITAEALGQSLLAQFTDVQFDKVTLPYVDTIEKAKEAAAKINHARIHDNGNPLIFDTIINKDVRAELKKCGGFMTDVFGAFLEPLEQELGEKSSYAVGGMHTISRQSSCLKRIEAMNFAIDNDDGARIRQYPEADIILVGVSRSGKTPASIYLALQYGIKAANFPLTEDDFEDQRLPASIRQYKSRIFGLTIDPERLHFIRSERAPNSRYSSAKQCRYEIEEVELIYKRERIPFINSTDYSIEEISTRLLMMTGLEKHYL